MSTLVFTSGKQRSFVEEGLKDPATQEYKAIDTIGGVGDVSAGKFKAKGYNYAYNLVGQFMLFSLDEELMMDFLEDFQPKKQHRASIVATLKMWCDQHL
eukprot:m.32099 g.32099  ORF g.32099 m.32099 type:complete len:99 (-) comp14078_c0_seq1:182-478(-)